MGSRAVPVGIAQSPAQQAPVPHIHGDEEDLVLLCRNSALAQDHRLGVDIVVHGGELFFGVPVHPLDDDIGHGLAVLPGKFLHDRHIMEVLLKELALAVGKMCRDVGLLGISAPADLLFDLPASALRAHIGNELPDAFRIAVVEAAVGLLLVIAGHLHPQMAGSGVDDQAEPAVRAAFHFDEVVAAAEGTDAVQCPFGVDVCIAVQPGQIDLCGIAMGRIPHGKAGGDGGADELVELLGLEMRLPQDGGLHAAADVHAHEIGDELVGDGHGGADGAALACMDIGHDADRSALCEGLAAQLKDLCGAGLVRFFGKNAGAGVCALDDKHSRTPVPPQCRRKTGKGRLCTYRSALDNGMVWRNPLLPWIRQTVPPSGQAHGC